MKTITVVATFQAKPGKETELKKALLTLPGPTRLEAGCINYDLHVSSTDAGKFLFYENWTSKELLDAHLQSPHIHALLPRLEDLAMGMPEIVIWEKIG